MVPFSLSLCGYLQSQEYRNGERNTTNAGNGGMFTKTLGKNLGDSGECYHFNIL